MRKCSHCKMLIDGRVPVDETGEFCPHCTRSLNKGGSSKAWPMWVGVALALPVLNVLSLAPMVWLRETGFIPRPIANWLFIIYLPIIWLCKDNPALVRLIEWYGNLLIP